MENNNEKQKYIFIIYYIQNYNLKMTFLYVTMLDTSKT